MKSRWFVFFLGMLFGMAVVLGCFWYFHNLHRLPTLP
jgi:hypothetical protein